MRGKGWSAKLEGALRSYEGSHSSSVLRTDPKFSFSNHIYVCVCMLGLIIFGIFDSSKSCPFSSQSPASFIGQENDFFSSAIG